MPASNVATLTRPARELRAVQPVGRVSRRRAGGQVYVVVGVVSLVLAVVSLLYPSAPAYDPWAWVIWGREIVHLQLHTVGGPTWKPLPVLFTTLFAPFGSVAPALWMMVARAGGLMAVALAGLLAFRLSGSRRRAAVVSAILASLGLLAVLQFFDSVIGGESEGLLAALSLLAILRHLDGMRRQALWLAYAAALIRPESWPFLGLYCVYLWRSDPAARRLIGLQLVSIPMLWFGPDLLGSGSVVRGVQWARFAKAGSPAYAHCPFCAEITGHAWPMVAAPFKIGVGLAVGLIAVGAVHGRSRNALLGLLAVGLAWIVEEAVFTQVGFSGSDRYLLAPVALLVVAGAVGWGLVLRRRNVGLAITAMAATVLLAAAGQSPGLHLGRALDQIRYQARLAKDLRHAVREAGGATRLLACGPIQANPSEVPLVAWSIGTPMRSAESDSGTVIIRSRNGPRGPELPAAGPGRGGHQGYRTLVRTGTMSILSRCS